MGGGLGHAVNEWLVSFYLNSFMQLTASVNGLSEQLRAVSERTA